MPAEYFYNGHLRWSVYWGNPNFMACFFSCALVWLWLVELRWARSNRLGLRIGGLALLYGLELCSWFVLVKTYSRGGLLAALCALLCFFTVVKQGNWNGLRRKGLNLIVRVGLILFICVFTGFAGRVSPGYLAQDMSVSNRLELWRGGLAMIWDSPFAGWGFKQGGMAYVNWYQSIEQTVRPTSFVNGYLELTVNHGVPALFLSLSVLLVAVAIAVTMRKHSWCVAAGSCVIAWMIGNIWTCCWYEWSLWLLPSASAISLFVIGIRNKGTLGSCICGVGLALFIVAGALSAGYAAAKNTYWQAKPLDGADVVKLSRRDACTAADNPSALWVDGTIFGTYYGKSIRASASSFDVFSSESLIVYAPWHCSDPHTSLRPEVCVYSGFHASRVRLGGGGLKKTIVLYPSVYPPEGNPPANHEMAVCLPLADTSQYDRAWRIWTAKMGAKLVYSSQGGRLISPASNPVIFSTANAEQRVLRSEILLNMGKVDMNGLPRLSLELGGVSVLSKLGFNFQLTHGIRIGSNRSARSEWSVTGLRTCVYFESHDQLVWVKPAGQKMRYLRQDMGFGDGNDGSSVNVFESGVIEIKTCQGSVWRYKDGFLETITDAQLGRFAVVSDRESILEISRLAGDARIAVARIGYAENGLLQHLIFSGDRKCNFEWSHDHRLLRVENISGVRTQFEYDDALLTGWHGSNGASGIYRWAPRDDAKRGVAVGRAPVVLTEDDVFRYEYARDGNVNIILVHTVDGSFVSETKIGPGGIFQRTANEIKSVRNRRNAR
ncbi:O-antigen ligase family protein [Termitidicoccus mucosus]|uniref:O-antigen ligase family protein n=2 Tax=Termitidicoccus mucosus TaxID=1184151 RepID=UPI0031841E22